MSGRRNAARSGRRARDGLAAATLRNVAAEANLAIGSIRHYFDGHDELIIFAAQELGRRISQRVRAHAEQIFANADNRAERRRLSEALLEEWLPLDGDRHRETVLRHTFTVAARTRAELSPHAEALRDTMIAIIHRVLTSARDQGGLSPEIDIGLETARLHALLDGLSLQGLTEPRHVRRVLRHHLDALPQTRHRG
ncbi:TetR family transcriptional regulator C-terminal domain-containing protein [Actinoplanes sichuanensis]|uniref:TetR/AcrR family transcriptional regulator n=2 Tax=Actinoplanes sichuanensis TaxID=512349 RepID=A0ABW4AU38_9ACTN|nr:TetR family transcriptional regulator C-terminal domain-containing protein [Actinoplanes sichuanensis]